ncbi:hypothetical protein BJX96DRAFT_141702 [Aspergillus floccosus]
MDEGNTPDIRRRLLVALVPNPSHCARLLRPTRRDKMPGCLSLIRLPSYLARGVREHLCTTLSPSYLL